MNLLIDYKSVFTQFLLAEAGTNSSYTDPFRSILDGFFHAIGGCNVISSDCIRCATAGVGKALSEYKMDEEKPYGSYRLKRIP